ncbi:MAG: helix-turn-helix domain-containing protein [Fusobacteriaceae bacterium]|nr:helix-turn-helix domain-containing protein [Fusobacteriaceae bacterium]
MGFVGNAGGTPTLEKLCEFFNCTIQDIIEYIPNKDLSK